MAHLPRLALLRAAAVLMTVALMILATVSLGDSAGAENAVPYSDPDAVGYIGLCNQQGQQITSGSVSTTPFAWRAVSSAPAPAPYDDASRTAILMAYQPIQGLAPGDWSGDQLTASSHYSNPANPMAAATATDWSLAQFMGEYQPDWDGFLQLRIYLGAAKEPSYSLHYPTLDIQVTGGTWHAMDGGAVNCASGTATSNESTLLPASQPPPPGSSAAGSGASSGAATPTTTTSAPGRGGAAAPTLAGPSAEAPRAGASSGSVTPAPGVSSQRTSSMGIVTGVVAALALLALAALGVVLARRRRRRPPAEPSADAGPSPSPAEPELAPLAISSTKGDPQ